MQKLQIKDMNKKGQTGGLITSLVFGIAALVIGVIIAFVVISTLTGADLLNQNRASSTVDNETGASGSVFINATTYTLDEVDATTTNFAIVSAWNATSGLLIPSSNYSVGTTTGIVTNTSANYVWTNASIKYTYDTLNPEELSADLLSGNFTEGIDNVSEKIPTVLLVAAIILILGVLAVLVAVWQRMRLG